MHTYTQILKSSAMIGGSSVVNAAVGIVRSKVMALLLGPSGIGLMGLYTAIADLAQAVAGVGLSSSGVRQIAEAASSQDEARIARTTAVLMRTAIVSGLLGAGLMLALRDRISAVTFGSNRYSFAVALLSAAVFFKLLSGAQSALIQGLRRISDLAMAGIWGSLLGSVGSVVLVYLFREDGVVPSIIGVAASTFVVSWMYSRRVHTAPPRLTIQETRKETTALLKLGVAFMASGLMMLGSSYVIRVTVLRQAGMVSAGLYQSAWALGSLYVGFILQSMGADFYPRLTAVARDNASCNRLVNEQTHVSLLMSGPGVLATVTFAPVVLSVLYSAEFVQAVGMLRWICLGMALRVITWPVGYIILAKGEQNLFLITETVWTIVHITLAWIFVGVNGLNGAGIAFWGSYVFHAFLVYPIARRISGFHLSSVNIRTGALFLASITGVFCGFYVLPSWLATGSGAVMSLLGSVYSIRVLATFASHDLIPPRIHRALMRLRLLPSCGV